MAHIEIIIRRVGSDHQHCLVTDDNSLDRGDGWLPFNVYGWDKIEVTVKRHSETDAPAYFWLGDEAP